MGSNTNVASGENESTESKLKWFSHFGKDWVEITAPIFTISEANGGVKSLHIRNGKKCYKAEHWTDKHKRHKLQKGSIHLLLKPLRSHLKLPCKITLTRYAPKKLDKFDNLPCSFKYILDAVCEVVTNDYRAGRADGTDEIDVSYKQVISSHYGVRIRIDL